MSHADVPSDFTYNYAFQQRPSGKEPRSAHEHRPFIRAVVEGRLPRVNAFLRMGVDLDKIETHGLTVLHRAVLSGHEDVVRALIEAGADVNAVSEDFGTPLCLAALKGLDSSIMLLLRNNARANVTTRGLGTALHCCAYASLGSKDTVAALKAAGGDLHAQVPLDTHWLLSVRDWDGDDRNDVYSLPRNEEQMEFHNATPAILITHDLMNRMAQFLPQGSPMDDVFEYNIYTKEHAWQQRRETYLMFHAKKGNLDVVRWLLQEGASAHGNDRSDNTHILEAAFDGLTDTVQLLIAHGAHVNSENRTGCTPLLLAAYHGSKDTVELLLENGASHDHNNRDGHTALTKAADCGWKNAVLLLLECGASVNAIDNSGHTAFTIAAGLHGKSVFETLLKTGAVSHRASGSGPNAITLAAQNGLTDGLREIIWEHNDTRIRARNSTCVLRLYMFKSIGKSTFTAIGRGLGFEQVVLRRVFANLKSVQRGTSTDPRDRERWLVQLSAEDSLEALQLILLLGGDINIGDSTGWTPIQVATINDDLEAVDRLLAAGAILEPHNPNGAPPQILRASHQREGAGDQRASKQNNDLLELAFAREICKTFHPSIQEQFALQTEVAAELLYAFSVMVGKRASSATQMNAASFVLRARK